MTELLNRRFKFKEDGVIARVVADDGPTVLLGKRGQQAQRVPRKLVEAALASGAVVDITAGRACPECGAPMDRDPACVIGSLEPRVINGFYMRNQSEWTTKVRPAWLCTACEHCEEER